MKKSIGLAALALTFALAGGAQAQEHSMTGCLEKGDAAGTYKLTHVMKGPKEVVIAESTVDLADHVGHKVKITGVTVPGKDKVHTMKVTAMEHISATCP